MFPGVLASPVRCCPLALGVRLLGLFADETEFDGGLDVEQGDIFLGESRKQSITFFLGQAQSMMLNAIRCEHSSGIFHELTMFRAQDRHRYERELLSA